MNQKNFLLKGTVLLTAAGILTRLLGFFYRIFLSRTIGAEGLGIYHLILPILSFCMAAAAGGMQTAISRFCAESFAREDDAQAERILGAGLTLSLSGAALVSFLLWQNADLVARRFLVEPRCAELLRIAVFSLPFSMIHSCISGYFIGKKRVQVSALSQLLEQLIRIIFVMGFYLFLQTSGQQLTVSALAFGQVAGEVASSFYCTVCCLRQRPNPGSGQSVRSYPAEYRRLLNVSMPLGLNRMLICVLQGIEAALLPQQLVLSGQSVSNALALYGVLTGMALPLLFFPTAITGALGTLLLPAVSEARVLDKKSQLSRTVEAAFRVSLLLGLICFYAFRLFGRQAGTLLFANETAGRYILSLACLCPFLYLNTTLVSILHGFGKTFAVSVQTSLGFAVRLLCVVLLVPQYGMDGYFLGLFVSQLLMFGAGIYTLHASAPLRLPVGSVFLKPLLVCSLSAVFLFFMRKLLPFLGQTEWISFVISALVYLLVLAGLAAVLLLPDWKRPKE